MIEILGAPRAELCAFPRMCVSVFGELVANGAVLGRRDAVDR